MINNLKIVVFSQICMVGINVSNRFILYYKTIDNAYSKFKIFNLFILH